MNVLPLTAWFDSSTPRRPRHWSGLACAGLLCLLWQPAEGQVFGTQRLFGRYQQFNWTDQHGLPQNSIGRIAQTPDGYLWLATAEGIVRFDGVRFTAFDTANTPELKSNNVAVLLVDRAGALWAGYSGGVTRYHHGRFTFYGAAQGMPDVRVKALFEDRAGNLWIGTQGGGVSVFRAGRFAAYTTQNGLPDNRVWAFAETAADELWIGTLGGLARFKDGNFTNYYKRDGLASEAVRSLCLDRAGTLWIGGEYGGLTRWQAGRFSTAGVPAGVQRHRLEALAEDREGTLWLGTFGGGLYRFKDERFEFCAEPEGLANDELLSIYPAGNGDLWLGTSGGGLVLLKSGRFSVYTTQDGLPDDVSKSIRGDGAGNLWVHTLGGLSRFKDGRFVNVAEREGLPARGGRALATDRAGHLLASAPGQVLRFKDGRFGPYVSQDGLAASQILEDRAGRLWVGTSFDGDGLHCFYNGAVRTYTTRDGLAENYITALYEDRAGNLWVGTGSGTSRVSEGRVTTWAHKDGYPGRHMLAFYEDRAGQVWLGTDGNGLLRFKDGAFKAITVKDGLYDNLAFQILEDDHGNLWMSGNKGIYRASLKELNDFADGRAKTVTSYAYGAMDGMLSRECNGASPAGWKTADGRLWFPTIKVVVAVNPQTHDTEPPRVIIENVTLDGIALPADQPLRIKPGQERLEMQYTALSWNRPQQLRFKYQLLGLDQGWTDAGTRRTAYYPVLPPGEYTFRVLADNGEGVWNETGASLLVTVLTPFHRTWWFRLLLGLSVAGLGWAGYQMRVRQLDRARAAQEEFSRRLLDSQESERNRIAAELHDSLGQSMLIIKNRAYMALEDAGDPEAIKEQLQGISDSAGEAIAELREIAYDLRPYQLERFGLTKTLHGICQHAERASGIVFEAELDALDGLFARDAEVNLYRIVQEGVNNIIKHSQATEALLRIRRDGQQLHLLLRDNGRGLRIADSESKPNLQSIVLNPQSGGFGLIGIAERVRRLNGSYTFESTLKSGVALHAVFPLSESS
jgi:ligand-binding sensor domain-containing protein/signal transduction histidine kinase